MTMKQNLVEYIEVGVGQGLWVVEATMSEARGAGISHRNVRSLGLPSRRRRQGPLASPVEGDIQLIFPDFSFLHAGGPPTLRTMQRPGLWGYMDLEMAVTRVTGWLTRTRDLRLPESHADLVDLGTSLHSVSHSARSLTPVLPALRQHPRLRPNPCKQTPR